MTKTHLCQYWFLNMAAHSEKGSLLNVILPKLQLLLEQKNGCSGLAIRVGAMGVGSSGYTR
jgi:hypothetical protein